MVSVDATLLELFKLLPRFVEIEKLLENEIEAVYILRRAADHFEQLQTTGETDAAEEEEVAYLTRALVDKSWERIHTGPFSSVPKAVRNINALGCYFSICFLLLESTDPEQTERCSLILDRAHLLGCTVDLYDRCTDMYSALMQYLDEASSKDHTKTLPVLPAVERRACRCDIPQLDAPSIREFQTKCYQALQPTLLLNTINHWPALRKWRDLNYLLRVAGNRRVPIEIGSNYACDEWSQQLVKIRDFLHRQFGQDKGDVSQDIEYLAQHELFEQVPALQADICVPDYCSVSAKCAADVNIKAWLGPRHTKSPLHHDPKHNLLCQVFGSKSIILASPADTENLYAHPSEFLLNTSQIDAAQPDLERYPLVSKVRFYELLLQPGDCLYMPPKWWHYVRAETPSFSVSFWWDWARASGEVTSAAYIDG